MNSLSAPSEMERSAAHILAYTQSVGVACELCCWTPPPIFNPKTMDYQCFATWPMVLPEETHLRDVVLCRDCFEIITSMSPVSNKIVNNPEVDLSDDEEDHDEFEGFDYNDGIFRIESFRDDVKDYIPQETSPAMAALFALLPFTVARCSDPKLVCK